MAAKFEKFLISPDFPINFRKSHQISKNYLERSKSYGQKPLVVPKDPPGLNRVNGKLTIPPSLNCQVPLGRPPKIVKVPEVLREILLV